MAEDKFTALVKPTDKGWFWRVAQDWPNGRGWHGEEETQAEALQAAADKLRGIDKRERDDG